MYPSTERERERESARARDSERETHRHMRQTERGCTWLVSVPVSTIKYLPSDEMVAWCKVDQALPKSTSTGHSSEDDDGSAR